MNITIRSARTRRLAAAAAAITAGTLVLAACSGGGDATAPEGGESAAGGESAELTVWHYFNADNQVQLMDDYAAMFEEAHDGVTVNNVFVPYDQMNSKVISAAGAQQGPDVVVFNGAEWSTLAMAGALAPLNEYWDGYADADQLPESVIHGMDDNIYAVQGYVNLLGLWYNADILAEIGVEPPTTLDELEAAMATAKDAGYMGITLSGLPQSQGEWQAYPWLTSQGFDYADPDEAALTAGFEMVRGWIDDGFLSQEAVTWDQTVPFQQFTSGKVAFAENGNWQSGAAATDASFEYGVVALPLGDSGKVYLGGEGQSIGAFSANPDLAWVYLQATYLSAEGQAKAVELVGSIPSRADASQDAAVTDDPLLAPFSQTLNEMGANYPDAVVPPEAVADLQTSVGQAWSSALAGQMTPQQAAAQVMTKLQTLLG
ncbi:extracellular solute-binding protein [Georgenia yuyongxinii]|uniref:Extracellular solute-binding protein n=1 Tax=Georgenia yuyongxinii TaxID=2589797 RepID=A0A5B8C4U7_9MICO|nr:extracellular solute-binding protein [Georgenia yuyongxinii]QDC25614.1 extracellular solute-binding protein [Georgenia yuyongxinii]